MNERIKELAEQANGFFHPRWDNREGAVEFQAKNLEKFAELIIKECIGVVEDSDGYSQYFPHVTENIEKHFGVEE